MITIFSLTPEELRQMLYDMSRITSSPIPNPTCFYCSHFNKGGACSMWGEVVPVEAWRDGCEHADGDDIPF